MLHLPLMAHRAVLSLAMSDEHATRSAEHHGAARHDDGRAKAAGHWALFIPPAAVAAVYLAAYGVLELGGAGEGDLARLCLVVALVATPVLVAIAFLRFETVRLEADAHTIAFHSGRPGGRIERRSYDDIVGLEVRRGLMTGRFGMATVVLELKSGRRVALAGLGHPEAAIAAIEARLAA
ncbi:MAG TPA: PH domain-containing protein [Hyphomicrobiales bacterium]|nr:PH domain-containing protein [Kaistiaceae bacterium]HQF30938.1 PH domain-containing protein [Hyphomicrobiales bacterium]